jgi:sigma-E factor negative regulatory protein RseB
MTAAAYLRRGAVLRAHQAAAGRHCLPLLLALAGVLAGPCAAAAEPGGDADSLIAVLQKVQNAARSTDYAGVFTYQEGAQLQSTRVVHMVDGTGERELLDTLDGPPREFIRHNEQVQYLIPEKKLIVMLPRRADQFPGVLLGDGKSIPANYTLTREDPETRVAGRECHMLELRPRDAARYGYRLCTDAATSLLLKAQTLSPQREVVDQVSFTSLRVGQGISSDELNSRWKTKGWQVHRASVRPVDLSKQGWRIPAPPGFQAITQVTRSMRAGRQVSQLVLSDGLAAISVFIEPTGPAHAAVPPKGAVHKGAMNIFGTKIGDHWLTAIGEVPVDTLRGIAQGTEYVPLIAPQP